MQAALITAYKDEQQLCWLVHKLSSYMKVFVHIDKKSKISEEKIRGCNCQVIKRYNIRWGSFEHLAAITDLIRLAVNEADVNYLHIITGQDVPVRGRKWFAEKFERTNKIYMSCNDRNVETFNLDRMRHYYITTRLDPRRFLGRKLNILSNWVQDRLGIRRSRLGGFSELYKGVVYVSMPSEAAKHVLTVYEQDRKLRFDLKHTLIPEEYFFQTILMNSPFAKNVVKGHLRYMDWNRRNGSEPAYLDESDYEKIRDGEYAFARKIDSRISRELVTLIEKDFVTGH